MLLQKLEGYFHGANYNHTKFPPSVPVLSHYIPRKNYTDGGKEFIVLKYVPKKCNSTNSTAPAPFDPDVHVRDFPATKIYVRQFGGLGFSWSVLHETFAMARALKRNGVRRMLYQAELCHDLLIGALAAVATSMLVQDVREVVLHELAGWASPACRI